MQAINVEARGRCGPTIARGFTLIELMVTLAVAAVLVTWSVPSLKNILIGNRLTAQTNDLIATLQFARSEAVKRNLPVNVTASDPGSGCPSDCQWKGGWTVWVDGINGGTLDGTPQDLEKLRVASAITGFENLGFSTDRDELVFLPSGAVQQPAGVSEVEFSINTTDMTAGENHRAVCIAYAGVVVSKRGTSAPTCP